MPLMNPARYLLPFLLLSAPAWAVTDDPWTTKPQKLSERLGTGRTSTPAALALNPDQAIQKKAGEVRPMATDRPDQTDGVYTVPKGWWQFETGLLSYSRRLDTDNRNESFIWGAVNANYGLTARLAPPPLWQAWPQNPSPGDPAPSLLRHYPRTAWNGLSMTGKRLSRLCAQPRPLAWASPWGASSSVRTGSTRAR